MFASGCSAILPEEQYGSPETRIKVVDAVTKDPVRGAIVVANWEVQSGHSYPTGQIALFEVVTDTEGYLTLPAWGPKKLGDYGEYMASDAPVIRIFKPGYYLKELSSGVYPSRNYAEEARRNSKIEVASKYNHQGVELKPFEGGDKEYAHHLEELEGSMMHLQIGGECNWPRTPLIYISIDIMAKYFRTKGIQAHLSELRSFRPSKECGDPAEIFGDLYNAKQ